MPELLSKIHTQPIGKIDDLRLSMLRFDYLDRMLTEIGIWQHSTPRGPDVRHGYSIDDQARGLIVGLRHWAMGERPKFNERLAATCFKFLQDAAVVNAPAAGRYHNFCDAAGMWLDSVGSEDSFGRTLWALGVAHAVDAPFAPRSKIAPLLERSLSCCTNLKPARSKAFVILGLGEASIETEIIRALADSLVEMYETSADNEWRWFEPSMTYCNARLPHALLVAGEVFPTEPRYHEIALEAVDFLLKVTRTGKNNYAPIGNAPLTSHGWFQRGDLRPPPFDQQPVDAGALVECCVKAYQMSGEPRFRQAATDAFRWYHGQNIHELPVYNPESGFVADAITRTGTSKNGGAESVVSYHLAYQALTNIFSIRDTSTRKTGAVSAPY